MPRYVDDRVEYYSQFSVSRQLLRFTVQNERLELLGEKGGDTIFMILDSLATKPNEERNEVAKVLADLEHSLFALWSTDNMSSWQEGGWADLPSSGNPWQNYRLSDRLQQRSLGSSATEVD